MDWSAVVQILRDLEVTHLHHANTVTTACTFLANGGLLSRQFVEQHDLRQTAQYTDAIDKRYHVWDRIFVDHVNIHGRAGRSRGPNSYGPVLFRIPLVEFEDLPPGTEIGVTRSNPKDWKDGEGDAARWFGDEAELRTKLKFGNFEKMIVLACPTGRLAFPNAAVELFLDDPERTIPGGGDAYASAVDRLTSAAAQGGVAVTITRHPCTGGCACVAIYRQLSNPIFAQRFGDS